LREYSNSQISAAIDEWVHSERNRKIMKRRYIDGVIFDDLASEFDLSVRQVKTIVYRETERLFKHYP
jgi:DNA-directed RNA polymerase specialized sigma24 family protein